MVDIGFQSEIGFVRNATGKNKTVFDVFTLLHYLKLKGYTEKNYYDSF